MVTMKDLVKKKKAVDCALNFLKAIKNGFPDKIRIHKLHQIMMHHKTGKFTTEGTIESVNHLLAGRDDLLLGFKRFHRIHDEKQRAEFVEMENDPVMMHGWKGTTGPLEIKNNLAMEHDPKRSTRHVEIKSHPDTEHNQKGKCADQELSYLERVQPMLGAASFEEFQKCIEIYGKQVISRSEVINLVNHLLADYPDLTGDFEDYLANLEDADHRYSNKKSLARPIKRIRKVKKKPDPKWIEEKKMKKMDNGASHKRLENLLVNPSYKLLAQSDFSSNGKSVLNNQVGLKKLWISNAGYDGSLEEKRENPFEDVLHQCEDDRFEFDMVLIGAISTSERVKELLKMMEDGTIKPGSPIQTEDHFSSFNLRCIEHLYAECGLDVIDNMRNHPYLSLPVILARLMQKEEELMRCGANLNKVWAKVYSENHCKSLEFLASEGMARRNTFFKSERMERKIIGSN